MDVSHRRFTGIAIGGLALDSFCRCSNYALPGAFWAVVFLHSFRNAKSGIPALGQALTLSGHPLTVDQVDQMRWTLDRYWSNEPKSPFTPIYFRILQQTTTAKLAVNGLSCGGPGRLRFILDLLHRRQSPKSGGERCVFLTQAFRYG